MGSSKIAEHNLSPELLELIRNGGAQADWNESDSGASSYVKNKTHYEEKTFATVNIGDIPMEEQTLTFENGRGEPSYQLFGNYTTPMLLDGNGYNEGVTYIVTWDGIEYELVCYLEDGASKLYQEGKFKITEEGSYGPIIYSYSGIDEYGEDVYEEGTITHTLTLKKVSTFIHKLDHKYLYTPNWARNDEDAADYIKNRTHYEEAVKIAIFPETVLDFTDSEHVNVELSSALVADKEYVVVWDNAIRNVTPYEQSDGTVVLGYDGNTADEFFRVFYHTDSTVEVYSVAMSTSKTHTIEIYTAENIIHKLDHKYLYTPDWNQNDEDAADYVKGRTHYEEETLSQIYTVSIEAGNSNVSNDSDGINYINVDATRWVFDGVVYENVEYTNIQNDDFYLNVYSTDDFSLAFKTSFDNSSQIYIFDVFDTSASHTLEVYKIENIVHPLDEKYLPETVAKKDYVDEQIHLITSTVVSVLKTYDEIAVAETDGQTEFPIKLAGFDKATDTVFVVSGRTILAPVEDYNIVGANIVLNEGVPLGRTINIRVQKNVPTGEEGGVSGRVIMDGTLPLSKLEEKVSVQQGGLYINSETTEEDKAEAQEALKEIGGFLPLDGSVPMTGKLAIDANNGRLEMLLNSTGEAFNIYKSANSASEQVGINLSGSRAAVNAIRLTRNNKNYNLFGEHNKPIGSYTGNGSVTSRTIPIGGIGKTPCAVLVGSTEGIALVTYGCGMYVLVSEKTTARFLDYQEAHYQSDNLLTLATTNSALNKNGVTYYYQVL